MNDVFISYAEEDAGIGLALALGVAELGYAVSSTALDDEVVCEDTHLAASARAIGQSRAVVLIISPNSYESDRVGKEVFRAHIHGKRIISVLWRLTVSEFEERRSQWDEVLSNSIVIDAPSEEARDVVAPVIDALKALDIQPTGAPDSRLIETVRQKLDTLLTCTADQIDRESNAKYCMRCGQRISKADRVRFGEKPYCGRCAQEGVPSRQAASSPRKGPTHSPSDEHRSGSSETLPTGVGYGIPAKAVGHYCMKCGQPISTADKGLLGEVSYCGRCVQAILARERPLSTMEYERPQPKARKEKSPYSLSLRIISGILGAVGATSAPVEFTLVDQGAAVAGGSFVLQFLPSSALLLASLVPQRVHAKTRIKLTNRRVFALVIIASLVIWMVGIAIGPEPPE